MDMLIKKSRMSLVSSDFLDQTEFCISFGCLPCSTCFVELHGNLNCDLSNASCMFHGNMKPDI